MRTGGHDARPDAKRRRLPRCGAAVAVSLIGALLSACSPLNALNVFVPSDSYTLTDGAAYGDGPRRRLDIYRPVAGTNPAAGPVLVFFYGGSWKSGARGQYRFVGDAFARLGYTVVIPDYRLYPEVRFPGFMEDAAAAIAWTVRNLADAGGRRRPLFLMGHSAGAHIAALAAVDPRYLAAHDLTPARLCGVVGMAGPYAFDPLAYRSTRAVFAGLADPDEARPVKRIAAEGIPPFLLLHGAEDGTVKPFNTTEFAAALRSPRPNKCRRSATSGSCSRWRGRSRPSPRSARASPDSSTAASAAEFHTIP